MENAIDMAPDSVILTERFIPNSTVSASAPRRSHRAFAVGVVVFSFLFSALAHLAAAQAKFTFTAERKQISIGPGLAYPAWTYNGTVPGPLIRVKQGDDVQISLINHTTDAHGLYTHAAQLNDENFSGPPGAKELTYRFVAQVPGVFDYHCTAEPVLDHIAAGMYGMMIVDPKNGWPNGKAQEVMLVQGEFYGTPDAHGLIRPDHSKMVEGQPDFVVFNGRISRFDADHPIPIKVGQLVRVFFINIGPNLFSDFHVVGAIFSTVYLSGNPADALHDIQTLEVGPGDGAVFEFTVDHPGTYMFMDHSMGHAYKGAKGIFRATQ
jgi:nitrite reductase (NO-forming)